MRFSEDNFALQWNFEFHYHTDKANAAANMAPARFRPLTLATAVEFAQHFDENDLMPLALKEVLEWNRNYGTGLLNE